MGVPFLFSATPFELLKARSLCLEEVTQMKESLKRKKAVIFWLLTIIQAQIMLFFLLCPPFLLLHLDSCLFWLFQKFARSKSK